MATPPLDRAATVERLTAIATAGGLSGRALARALELTCESPRPAEWRSFLSRALLFLGAALLLAGVIFFFAFNWHELGRFAKLALLELAVAGAALGAWQLGRSVAGEMALAAAAILVGPLLAVYGQTYQTGADTYELFTGWALLILPWVVLARMPSLWLVELVLWNLALPLYVDERLDYDFWESAGQPLLATLDLAAWLTAEALQRRGVTWLKARWPMRVVAVGSFALVTPGAIQLVLDSNGSEHAREWICGGMLLGMAATAYLLSRRPARRDLFLLATSGAAVLGMVTCLIGRLLFEGPGDHLGGVILLALVVLGEVGALVMWLRHMGSAEVDEA